MTLNPYLLILLYFMSTVLADVYLQNMSGSNNRNDETTRPRTNGNRLFDSQNNERGGYNRGQDAMKFYTGSKVPLQWTSQHSCGDQNADCDMIIQVMCDEGVRDGTVTTTIPNNKNGNANQQYGRHEDFLSYRHCSLRERNKGLYTADQNLQSDSAKNTRQDNNGNRNGYECPEERDYYPYWHPTKWMDAAIFTNDPARCEYLQAESENVKGRAYCKVDDAYLENNANAPGGNYIPINEADCNAFTYTSGGQTKNGEWTQADPFRIPAPECYQAQWTRDNHLGATLDGEMSSFNWTIPDLVHESCVMRLRYNITTGEYNRDQTTADQNNGNGGGTGPDIWTRLGLDESTAQARGYELVGNPDVDVFGESKFKLGLAINTDQYGRTFQDRSHRFEIRSRRGTGIAQDINIVNVNVRGKRGNIVQVYPAVEYDFVPNVAETAPGDYINFQWTGSDNNPRNNDGEGTRGTDRSNVVLIDDAVYDEGQYTNGTIGVLGRSIPRSVNDYTWIGLDLNSRARLATLKSSNQGGNDPLLNNADAYFDLPPRVQQPISDTPGTYNYLSTRNNNFSNRSQKGKIVVARGQAKDGLVDRRGGKIDLAANYGATIAANAVLSPTYVKLRVMKPADLGVMNPPNDGDFVSDALELSPKGPFSSSITVTLGVNPTLYGSEEQADNYDLHVFWQAPSGAWQEVRGQYDDGKMNVQREYGGTFFVTRSRRARSSSLVGALIGVGVVVLVAIVIVFLYKSRILSGYKAQV